MPRIKAIFDADILIHLSETNSFEIAIETLGTLHVSDYVYQKEITENTKVSRELERLKNKGQLKVVTYQSLTDQQKKVYRDTYKLLEQEDISEDEEENPINEGERITAAFAKAFNIYYYMSDDNRASSYIKSLTSVDIVNFCDILYLHIATFENQRLEEITSTFEQFLRCFDEGKEPRILKHRGKILPFENVMGKCFDKFNSNNNLKRLQDHIKQNT